MRNNLKPIKIRVQRYKPEEDVHPYMDIFEVHPRRGMTVLDGLHLIKCEMDGSVTYRRSCRHAICGSCAMNINGKNTLACTQPLRDAVDRRHQISIRPLPYLPIIKDLVVDRSLFWRQYVEVRPWLVPPLELPEQEMRVSPAEVAALRNAEKCIMCGACYSSCQILSTNKNYMGPHALLKAFLRVLDPRDRVPGERLKQIAEQDGVFRCRTITNCIDACPKNLDPTQAIETLRSLVLRRLKFERERAARQKLLADPIS